MTVEFSGVIAERITLQRPVDTPDGGGGFVRVWQDVQEMWAQILLRAQDERRYGGHVAGVNRYDILVRRDGAIPLDARVRWREHLLAIVAVEHDPTVEDRVRIGAIEEREQ